MNANNFSNDEILAIFNNALKSTYKEDAQDAKVRRMRKAKADFCNLEALTSNDYFIG